MHGALIKRFAPGADVRRILFLFAEEEPQSKGDECQATQRDKDFGSIYQELLSTSNPRKRRAFMTTLTDESAIAIEAIIGLRSQPVNG